MKVTKELRAEISNRLYTETNKQVAQKDAALRAKCQPQLAEVKTVLDATYRQVKSINSTLPGKCRISVSPNYSGSQKNYNISLETNVSQFNVPSLTNRIVIALQYDEGVKDVNAKIDELVKAALE